jgi:hypothetical protein
LEKLVAQADQEGIRDFRADCDKPSVAVAVIISGRGQIQEAIFGGDGKARHLWDIIGDTADDIEGKAAPGLENAFDAIADKRVIIDELVASAGTDLRGYRDR